MYLKALEIQGFKSFPDKTVLNFGEDITAIVGPNGSGKSNISDAIRWVMGEQNSRQLRGAKMEDVIFGGTEKRSQMGFAQVTLVIDNTEHIFPTRDEAEVAVTRRYYRSGESEYYINRQSVRLKDVNELFMDTGMGREGYSIIGQGKIDEILSVKSGERREVFEEAAGISKYRHRKEESERKLERTQENLVRINDKIAELELQVEPLRRQAETAKKYLVLRDELRVLEISVWLENLQALKTGALKLRTDFEAAQADKDRAQDALDAVYAAAEDCAEQMRVCDVRAEGLRSEMGALESQAAEQESEIAVLRTGVAHNEESLERLAREMEDSQGRADGLQSQMDALERRAAEIERQTQQMQTELDGWLAGAQELAQQAGMDAALARRTAIGQELAAAEEKLEQAQHEAKENRHALREAQEDEQAAANIIQGHSLRMEGRRRRADETQQEKLRLTMELKTLTDRIALLGEMEKEYEGFSRAVKLVMRAAEKGALRGIRGPVASLMETDPAYTVALEIALGGGLQNIVVGSESDAKSAIALLKQRDGGRATFLPVSTVRGNALREQGLEQETGFVGIASRLVRYDRQYDGIFQNLLGRTVVVEDIDCGIAIARRYGHRFRIVTLDGQVIHAGGSMTGGSVSRSAGVLSRATELAALREKQGGLEQQLHQAEERAAETARDLKKAQYELDVAKEQQRQAESRMLTLEGRKNHYDVLTESLEASCGSLRAEAETITARTAADRTRAQSAQETIDRCEREVQALRAEAGEKLAGQSELLTRSGDLSQKITEHKSALAALQAERESALRSREDLAALRADMEADRAGRGELAEKFRRSNEDAQAEIARRTEQAQALHAAAQEKQAALDALSQEKLALEARRTATERESREANDTLLASEREVSRLEQKLNASAMEEKQILDRLWERYELSHSEAQAQRVELESVPKATRRIAELTRDIKALGTPNIGAIEEFERVNTRYTYLSEQRTDVERAMGELTGVIDELTDQMTKIFAEQFRLLNETFQETFLELFGGGKARLELEDESDILGCGIEIKVQPPGKQLKTITLLSGGEKAFVAIALYFAILKVHPTPFCVMDEIEAALDESNVVRYARYMRRIAGKTQFIVITHRRGTMEEADVLYGVTMQERGISKVLTINLNDMAKELKIK